MRINNLFGFKFACDFVALSYLDDVIAIDSNGAIN
jgi:hypothetical protein